MNLIFLEEYNKQQKFDPQNDIKYLLDGSGTVRDISGTVWDISGTVVLYDSTFKDGFHMKRWILALKLYCRLIK